MGAKEDILDQFKTMVANELEKSEKEGDEQTSQSNVSEIVKALANEGDSAIVKALATVIETVDVLFKVIAGSEGKVSLVERVEALEGNSAVKKSVDGGDEKGEGEEAAITKSKDGTYKFEGMAKALMTPGGRIEMR